MDKYLKHRRMTIAIVSSISLMLFVAFSGALKNAFAQGSSDRSELCGSMDIAFAVDDTGSMGDAIDNVKSELPQSKS